MTFRIQSGDTDEIPPEKGMQAVCSHCNVAVSEDTPSNGQAHCPRCGNVLGAAESDPTAPLPPCPDTASTEPCLPAYMGRYRIVAQVGIGSFATIYRGRDDELGRDVAIKALHARLLKSEKVLKSFLAEARILAGLKHPGIVPIYDIGRSDDGGYYLVTQFVEGQDLKAILKERRPELAESVEIVACIAEALDYAHRHGLVHRDVKPANILIDDVDTPLLVDFGLALRREEFGTGPSDVGTPLYMSPEQARKEGHRVDARSDVYSLGIVFYELLVGRHPFRGKTLDELRAFIVNEEAIPPRGCDPNIPPELERIWRKATALRAADRYATAREMAEDLRFWENQPSEERPDESGGVGRPAPSAAGGVGRPAPSAAGGVGRPAPSASAADGRPTPSASAADGRPAPSASAADGRPTPSAADVSWRPDARSPRRVVPRGLRAFRAEDAGFFLYLLPGPRGRDGLPESITFWKNRLESTDPETAFRVGVLYGPSGCGKSSLVRAGLLPHLGGNVLDVHLDASFKDTEERLRRRLVKHFPRHAQATLSELLAALRRGDGLAEGKKVVIIIDQFEQWLVSSAAPAPLTDALRQCDGIRVQALLLVRDDFWLPVSRFMHDLEVPLIEGANIGLVDLFDTQHARKVLAEFGRSFGQLPDDAAKYTQEQNAFLNQAVAGLAEADKVIPVRLTLFAEMVKGKPWTAETFQKLGGHEGVGLAFLDEALGAGAPAPRRPHLRAAMAVLQSLLPDPDAELQRRQRSRKELVEASGYDGQPASFEALLHVLDQELRLVAPVIEDGGDGGSGLRAAPAYQLTHDYLVPSLREWLRREQRQTLRGHADMRLADAASAWGARRENRMLPGVVEWLNIWLWSRRRLWTEPQRAMMHAANAYHARRGLVAALLLALLIGSGIYEEYERDEMRSAARADQLVATIETFHSSQVAEFQREVARLSKWSVPRLQRMIADDKTAEVDRMHARLVLLPLDDSQVEPLRDAMLTANVHEFEEVSAALAPYRERLVPQFWERFENTDAPGGERLRAACALAAYDAASPRWAHAGEAVVTLWLRESDFALGEWMQILKPVHPTLVPTLTRLFRTAGTPREQYVVSKVLANVSAGDPAMLAELCLEATPVELANLWPGVRAGEEAIKPRFEELLRDPGGDTAELRERRRARAAVALLRLGRGEPAWPLLRSSRDNGTRSFLIHDLAPCRVPPSLLVRRYAAETDVSAKRSLLLALGEYEPIQVSQAQRQTFAAKLLEVYRNDADAGLHAAGGWLLRHWGQGEALANIDRELRGGALPRGNHPGWFVNREGITLVRIPAPAEFRIGSPPGEVGREPDEGQHLARIDRPFAIASTEVTLRQFLRAQPKFPTEMQLQRVLDAPIMSLTWYDALRYCRWLSEQEGIAEDQMCYPPMAEIKPGMKLPDDWQNRTGYRLPTEAEWEYACRAGTTTSRFFGSSPALLEKYGWYVHNSDGLTHPVGLLKPNDWGLFDTYGNVWEWCADMFKASRGTSRTLRGGSFAMHPNRVRSAERYPSPAEDTYPHSGFRVVRTCP